MFHYEGQSRLAFFFANPNHEACLYTLFAFTFLAVTSFSARHGKSIWRVPTVIGLLLSFASQFCLILTYSRGGYVAFGFASLVAAFCVLTEKQVYRSAKEKSAKRWWQLPVALPIIFLAIIILVTPQCARRLASISSLQKDPSISHRLLLWKGGAAIV